MTILIADCETDGMLDSMTTLHMLQLGDADGDDVTIYCDTATPEVEREANLSSPIRPLSEGLARLRAAQFYVFHHGLGFDMEAINRGHPGTIDQSKLLDTLVMARLAQPQERRHDLRSWGQRLGVHKGDYKGDFQTITPEFLTYSEQDITVGRKLFHAVRYVLDWGTSYRLEHDVQRALLLQEVNGFPFDVRAAEDLDVTLRSRKTELEAALAEAFPPIHRETFIVPKVNNVARGYVKGTRCLAKAWDEPFNPGSTQHVAERLQMAGWVPSEFTPEGSPAVTEEILSTLPFPEAKLLSEYKRLAKLLGAISDGTNGYLKLVRSDGRIHGRVNGNGARTGRMTHSKPNTANIDKDPRVRSLFGPRAGWKLVGCDGEGIQLRILAHYLAPYDNGALADRIVNGTKDDGTDPHSVNMKSLSHLGKINRDGAKTMIYAKLFGSSAGGLAYSFIEACRAVGTKPVRMAHYALGAEINKALAVGMVGLDRLETKAMNAMKARKYLVGLDGRKIYSDHPRLALVSLCQGGEAVVMKKALVLFMERHGENHGITFGLCGQIHDEVQFEAHPVYAESLGQSFSACIREAGVALGVRCRMDGKAVVGKNWAETH